MTARVASCDPHDLRRFLDAQQNVFDRALEELRAGRKQGHWMWFIFPQLAGLGHSATAQYFGIRSITEALAYLEHPLLGSRLRQSVAMLLKWAGHRSAEEIFGSLDAMKLRSSLTLFDSLAVNDIFAIALKDFFKGNADERTLALLNAQD